MPHDHAREARLAGQELVQALADLHAALDEAACPETLAELADYAWNGAALGETELLNLLPVVDSADELCNANLMLPDGSKLISDTNRTLIQNLASAAHARMDLDSGEALRVDGLAALAQVAEKTVRMATNQSRPGAIRVRKEGHWAYIDASEALAWLERRNDFRPTGVSGRKHHQAPITDAASLASTCTQQRKRKAMHIGALTKALRWTALQRKAYEKIEAGELTDQMSEFPPRRLLALGEFLGLARPDEFARQGFQVLAAAYAEHLSQQQIPDAHP